MKSGLILLFILLASLPCWGANPPVRVEFFYQRDCADCQKVLRLHLPRLLDELRGRMELELLDLAQEQNFLRLTAYLDRAGDTSNETMYAVLNGQVILAGKNAVRNRLAAAIQEQYSLPASPAPPQAPAKSSSNISPQRFRLPMVIVAGLLDGINPCVFATLVFFISFLVAGASGRRQILNVGVVYIAGCFATYFALGLGLYQFLHWTVARAYLRTGLNVIVCLALLVFAGISFADAIRFRRQGAAAVIWQMPSRWKEYAHALVRDNRQKMFVLSGVLLLSVVVTLIESVCTGQVYVPTLLYLANHAGGVNQWWGLLLLYNLMFILPLVAVFVLTLGGIKVQALLMLSRHDVVMAKVLMGVFLLGLAVLLGCFEFFR